jgi:hypothetical protein
MSPAHVTETTGKLISNLALSYLSLLPLPKLILVQPNFAW